MLKGTMKLDSRHLEKKRNTGTSTGTQITGCNTMVNTHCKNVNKLLTVRGMSFRNSFSIKEYFNQLPALTDFLGLLTLDRSHYPKFWSEILFLDSYNVCEI